MSEKRTPVTSELEDYLKPYWADVDPILLRITEDLHRRGKYPMQISLEQSAFHQWLCRLIGAKRVLEVGTYLGLSATAFALALPADGHVDTVELEPEHAEIAEGWFKEAGLDSRVTVHRGPALEVVPTLDGPYDLAFLDGAKVDNPQLLRWCIDRVRPGGLILTDNAFQDGRVAAADDEGSVATRETLDLGRTLKDLDSVVVPVADGILISRRR